VVVKVLPLRAKMFPIPFGLAVNDNGVVPKQVKLFASDRPKPPVLKVRVLIFRVGGITSATSAWVTKVVVGRKLAIVRL
jgi:hypothetical protein